MSNQGQLLGAFWFLKSLLFSSLFVCAIFYALRRIRSITVPYLVLLVLLLTVTITKYFNITVPIIGDFPKELFCSVFFVLGYIYKKIEKTEFYCVFFVILMFLMTTSGLIKYNNIVGLLRFTPNDIFWYLLFSCSGILFVLSFSNRIEKLISKRMGGAFLYYMGNNTLIILALHFVCFKPVSFLVILLNNYPIEYLAYFPVIESKGYWPIYSFSGLCLPLIIQYSLSSIKKRIKYV